jgi:STE24 endopeptidase
VLYDNLLDDFSPEEVRLVIAHELAHVHYGDVPRGLLFLAIVAPFGMLAVARIADRFAPDGLGRPAAVPAVALAIAVVVPAITYISNGLSREVEARADRYAMELTRDPDGLVAFQRRITIKNVSDPEPPGWVHALLGTHPTAVERIGQALAFSRSREGVAAVPREGS